jgi:hypothetical protein
MQCRSEMTGVFCFAYARAVGAHWRVGIAGLQSSARNLICAESELGRRWVSSRRPRAPIPSVPPRGGVMIARQLLRKR